MREVRGSSWHVTAAATSRLRFRLKFLEAFPMTTEACSAHHEYHVRSGFRHTRALHPNRPLTTCCQHSPLHTAKSYGKLL